MKKAIVLLLALAVLGGAAFAQVTTAISYSGSVTLFDQNQEGVFSQDGNGYDLLTFKGATEDGMVGFSITDSNLFSGAALDTIRDWNVYYKLFDAKVRVMIGNLRNGDVRMTLPNWIVDFGATNRVTGYGVLTSLYLVDGLTLELNLPFGTTAAATADVIQMADFGAKYVITDIGTVIFLAQLDLVADSNTVNFGFTYSGMDKLTATALYQGIFAATSEHLFGLGVAYDITDALSAGVEFSGDYTTALAWDVAVTAGYTVSDALSAGVDFTIDSTDAYDVSANVDYMLADGLDTVLTIGYDSVDLYYSLDLVWSVAF